MHILTFAEFQNELGRITRLDPQRLTAETNLILDLGLDSLGLLQLFLDLEKLGAPLSLPDAWSIQTVADAYAYYQRAQAQKGSALKHVED